MKNNYASEYRKRNREKLLSYHHKYYLKNKKKIQSKFSHIKVICESCGDEFRLKSIPKARFCSKKCMGKFFSGKCNSNSYPSTYEPNNPNSYKGGSIKVHRLLMSRKLGRPLLKNEIVHHINENKRDNRIENLELTTRPKHMINHRQEHFTCTVSGCNKKHKSKGLCPAHYRRFNHGQELSTPLRKWIKK